jgi:hypothetical protein
MSDETRAPAWLAVADERLIARCEQHVADGERLRREPSLPTVLRAPRTHLDPADWRTGYLQVSEREISPELRNDLRELMPQALLRDLYRPVHEVGWVERGIVEGTEDRGGFGAMDEARAARKLPPLERIEPTLRTVRAFQTWRRALYEERWQPVLADDEPRRKVFT